MISIACMLLRNQITIFWGQSKGKRASFLTLTIFWDILILLYIQEIGWEKGADTKRRDKHEMPSNCLGLKQPWHLNMKRKVNRCYSAYEGDSLTIYTSEQ